jgi:acetyltransferase-like isoleucine patch superfamily enzyme
LKRVIGDFLTLLRWSLARFGAAKFGRPKHLGRSFEVGPNVRIGRGATIGHGVKIVGNVVLGEDVTLESGAMLLGSVEIGANTVVGRYTYVGSGPDGHVSIGRSVYINDFSKLGAMKKLTIEDHCIFAAFIQITDAEHGLDADQHIQYAPIRAEPVSIGEGVWLGSHVVVLKGVSIGSRSAVGAQSLVTADIDKDSIAFGIPARVHRARSVHS